jgi:hypothetical protein
MTRSISRARITSAPLTIDEARAEIVRSAAQALQHASCAPEGMLALLWALPAGAGWSAHDEEIAVAHRATLEWVKEAGHGSVIAEELLGVMAATGLADGEMRDLDLVVGQLPSLDVPVAS